MFMLLRIELSWTEASHPRQSANSHDIRSGDVISRQISPGFTEPRLNHRQRKLVLGISHLDMNCFRVVAQATCNQQAEHGWLERSVGPVVPLQELDVFFAVLGCAP